MKRGLVDQAAGAGYGGAEGAQAAEGGATEPLTEGGDMGPDTETAEPPATAAATVPEGPSTAALATAADTAHTDAPPSDFRGKAGAHGWAAYMGTCWCPGSGVSATARWILATTASRIRQGEAGGLQQ